jgi:HTH-type transcriptional regulator / antitoxin HigA
MDLKVGDCNPCYQKRDRNGMVVEGRVYDRDVLTHREYD